MKVFIRIDKTNKILGVYNTNKGALSQLDLDNGEFVVEFDVIMEDTAIKSISSVNEKVYDPKSMNDYIPFGKYKGECVGDVIEKDPKYMEFLVLNLNFSIDEECKDFLDDMLIRS